MMTSFRRANLRGSDELFRPTHTDTPASDTRQAAPVATATPTAAKPEGHLVRLTDEEVGILTDAIQRLKFPTSQKPSVTKPSVDEFERLEELRQKLISAR